ncbi:MAG: protein kinase [Minicystis sp.]
MELGPGTLIGGRYRLERLLGRGGMGEVWAAKHTVTRRDVALKFLNVDGSVMPQMRRRFMREARAATAVSHPNVIQIHDLFELENETPVMVMDLLAGEPLGDKLAREGSLSVEDTARILLPVVSAVGSAHALGIVHRDLKPENIFLVRSAEGESEVKVLDFGIAKLGSSMELGQTGAVTGTGAVLGTPYYMALEQAYGEKDIDHRADIWSLGVVMYECLAGRRPIEGDNFGQIVKFLTHGTIPPLAEIAPRVPVDLDQLVARMLQRAREDRPQDLREVLTVLRRYTGATVRTFGGPRAPEISGLHDVSEIAPIEPRHDAPTVRGIGVAAPRAVDPDMATIEVVSAERPKEAISQQPISTGKNKAPPVDVTLAESGTSVPAAAPPPASRRTALIAAAGAIVGIVVTAGVVLALTPGRGREVPANGTARVPATSVPEVSKVEREAVVATAVPVPTTTAVATVEPAPSGVASSEPVPVASGVKVKPGPLGSSKPAASSVASAQPAASSATPSKPKGGLVDEPPF